jgi:hypothetical protein
MTKTRKEMNKETENKKAAAERGSTKTRKDKMSI